MRSAIHKPYHPGGNSTTHRRQHSRRLTNPAMYRNCFSDMYTAVKRFVFHAGAAGAAQDEQTVMRPVISEPFNFKREGSGLQALQQAQAWKSETDF